MGRLLTGASRCAALLAVGPLAALLAVSQAHAENTVAAGLDVRGVASDGVRSYLDGGLGPLRFDADHQGLRLGDAWVSYRGDFPRGVHVVADAISYGDGDRYPLDLTQLYAEFRPFPHGLWRSRVRAGAFYAPLSFENRLVCWRSPYTLSFSAIDTWIGEELRTIGTEYDLDWLGRQAGHRWQFGVTASVYGFNDVAGVLLAMRGWALHDRQTTLFGRIGREGNRPVGGIREFYGNFDGRPGYYVGGNAEYASALQLRVLHYDNLADPAAFSHALHAFAWRTIFDAASVSWTPSASWTLIPQWIEGSTCAGSLPYCWQFGAADLLASWQHGAERVSARYDDFQVHARQPVPVIFARRNRGHAWTIAFQHDFNAHLSVAAEGLWIVSELSNRALVGEPAQVSERELQLALRAQL